MGKGVNRGGIGAADSSERTVVLTRCSHSFRTYRCSNKARPGFKLCEHHAELNRQDSARRRAACKATGICLHCIKEATPGYRLCDKHLVMRRSAISLRYRSTTGCTVCKTAGHAKKDHKKLGLCVSCSAMSSASHCDACRLNRTKQKEVQRQTCISRGICPVCQKYPLAESKSRCQECLRRNAAGVARRAALKRS